ncbi:MAG: hypothetical protein ACFCVD_05990 [Nodosilinea sp.]
MADSKPTLKRAFDWLGQHSQAPEPGGENQRLRLSPLPPPLANHYP